MTQYRPSHNTGPTAWARIHPGAITHNLHWLRQRLHAATPRGAKAPRLWAVVKSDAYGHGLQPTLGAIADAEGVCVGDLHEAHRARALGWRRPLLMLSAWGLTADELRDPVLDELHVVVDDPDTLAVIGSASPGLPRLHVWLRHAGHLRGLGFAGEEYARAFHRLRARVEAGELAAVGHLHHYAAPEHPRLVAAELAALSALTHDLPGPRCTGSSAALCNPDTLALHGQEDWVRCGLTLYGASALPGLTGASLGLMPAMSVQARILVVRRVAAGETVGYGAEFRANRNTCIGIVGIGYGHGVPRNLWQHGFVLAGRKGRRVPLAGRVAMDCLSIDLGPEPTEAPGDVVTLWGCAPGGAALPVEEAGQACDTIAAELLTGLTARLPLLVD